jgi:hypothetical protein
MSQARNLLSCQSEISPEGQGSPSRRRSGRTVGQAEVALSTTRVRPPVLVAHFFCGPFIDKPTIPSSYHSNKHHPNSRTRTERTQKKKRTKAMGRSMACLALMVVVVLVTTGFGAKGQATDQEQLCPASWTLVRLDENSSLRLGSNIRFGPDNALSNSTYIHPPPQSPPFRIGNSPGSC